jgi:hypothetical protein
VAAAAQLRVLVPVNQAAVVVVHVMLQAVRAHGPAAQLHNLANQQQPTGLHRAVTGLDLLVVQEKIPQDTVVEVVVQVVQALLIVLIQTLPVTAQAVEAMADLADQPQ